MEGNILGGIHRMRINAVTQQTVQTQHTKLVLLKPVKALMVFMPWLGMFGNGVMICIVTLFIIVIK